MSAIELKFLLWFIGILLALLAFVGIKVVEALLKMSDSVNEIKQVIVKIDTKHDGLEKRVQRIENQLEEA